ncbi:MAG: AsmA-like C-terminal region-containing protein, partial [Candidatus Acidiferrales bacterium]
MLTRKQWLAISAAAFILAACAALWFAHRLLNSYVLRDKVEKIAADRFHVDVELATLHVSLFPHLRAEFTNLVLKNPDRPDLPALIEIRKCSVETGILALLERRPHLHTVHMQGLTVNVPPHGEPETTKKAFRTDFVIDQITSDDMTLNILRKDSGRHLCFLVHNLRIDSFRPDNPATFHANLINPKPVGEIQTQGQFGPWNPDDPSQSPVSGSYAFSDADLGTIKGISGTLSSTGSFNGVLDYIQVQGKTETPDFEISISQHSVPLNTEFNAVVDGMNGNTILHTIDIQLLDSNLVAKGDVAKGTDQPGWAVALNVVGDAARIQDLLRVAVKSDKPLLTGVVALRTRFVIPSRRVRDTDIANRIDLLGTFGIVAARFTQNTIQEKINVLSHRGRGQPNDTDDGSAVSKLAGTFTLRHGVIRFSKLTFDVSGVAVLLNGTYNLDTEELNFRGTLKLEAKLSQTTTGVKSFLLKMIDPLFEKKKAGTVLPIKITGTREQPSFGLDMGRV